MKRYLIVLLLLVLAFPVFADPTPTPQPTPTLVIPSGELEQLGQEGQGALQNVNPNLTDSNGQSIIPTVDLSSIFGYVKWLVAPPTEDELAGPFAPIMAAFGTLLSATIVMQAIYWAIWIGSTILQWVVGIFKLILPIFQLVFQATSQIVGGAVGWIIGLFGL